MHTVLVPWASPLFSVLYEFICGDQEMGGPTGTNEHKRVTFDNMLFSDAFTKKGAKVMLRRWFSWFDAFAEADKTWHTRILSLITFGMSTGIYKDITEVPLWSFQGED